MYGYCWEILILVTIGQKGQKIKRGGRGEEGTDTFSEVLVYHEC